LCLDLHIFRKGLKSFAALLNYRNCYVPRFARPDISDGSGFPLVRAPNNIAMDAILKSAWLIRFHSVTPPKAIITCLHGPTSALSAEHCIA
jgi:hypothetical protein